MNSYVIGFGSGFLTVMIVCVVVLLIKKFRKKSGNAKNQRDEYDERQKILRGQAATFTVYAMLVYNVLCVICDKVGIFEKIDYSLVFFGCVFFGSLVFICICIWNNSYLPVGSKPLKTIIWLFVFSALNTFCGLMVVGNEGYITDGKLNVYNINFMACLLTLLVAINLVLKMIVDSKLAKKVEDEES